MAQNSQIQAKGVGKDSKRHDLDGTPGLSAGSSVNYGETGQLEAGQKAVQNTQAGQGGGGAIGAAEQQQGAAAVPDPIAFAGEKVGGEVGQLPQQNIEQFDTAEFLPMLKRLATGNSSSILKEAYMKMVANLARKPWSGTQTAVIDRQELDRGVEAAF